MTKERLEELEELMRLYPEGTHTVFVENKMERTWIMDAPMITEMVRLAKLGLCAEIVLKQKEYYLAKPNKIDGIFHDLEELPDAAR